MMHYNFTKNKTAIFLKEKRGLNFAFYKEVPFEVISGVTESKIKILNGYAIYKNKEDEYLMFHYKRTCYTYWYGKKQMPKFHPFNCDVQKKFSGFEFANKMPVDIYSRDEQKVYPQQTLKICYKCKKEIFKSNFGDSEWFDTILKYVESQETPTFKNNGYHTMWNQISEAYREKRNWACENCHITLEDDEHKRYLHTHHRNGNIKDNRILNFQSLCYLCHALEHPEKIIKGTAFFEIDSFIKKFHNLLDHAAVKSYYQLKKNHF